jgi:hypothetical protein
MSQMSKDDIRERLGNIDQIRDVIIGPQLRNYENRFSKIESDISLLQQHMRSHIEQLKDSFSTELKTAVELLEKKIKSVSASSQEEGLDLRQQVERLNRRFSSNIQSLDEALDSQTTIIREEVTQTKGQLQGDINALRDLVVEELERRFSLLTQTKVSKDDIAETLFALGMRLKGTELIPQLREAADENNYNHPLPLLESTKFPKVLSHSNGVGEID